jgi:hypothetical protein
MERQGFHLTTTQRGRKSLSPLCPYRLGEDRGRNLRTRSLFGGPDGYPIPAAPVQPGATGQSWQTKRAAGSQGRPGSPGPPLTCIPSRPQGGRSQEP